MLNLANARLQCVALEVQVCNKELPCPAHTHTVMYVCVFVCEHSAPFLSCSVLAKRVRNVCVYVERRGSKKAEETPSSQQFAPTNLHPIN